ncbi:hypothetical protein [Kitasatospora sp. GP82]|uniref:hypothetical protein n=1 Tax=Kitasatospora sp. GP82 TaxID=3035089 RepID=UPI002476FBE9|nr:hypothetical protein [Kitasatospora sp. GP82]MDH6127422.1 hypothetical protein [Kitasatospora sp. GP82]
MSERAASGDADGGTAARMFALALRLIEVTGTGMWVAQLDGGGYRVNAVVPHGIGEEAELVILDLLAKADRYGHWYRSDAQAVWAELDCARGVAQVERAGIGTRRVTVEIEGIAPPATFDRMPDALTAVWGALAALPLDPVQADAFRYFFTRPDAVEHVTEFIQRDGALCLAFSMAGRSHAVRVRPAGEESARR